MSMTEQEATLIKQRFMQAYQQLLNGNSLGQIVSTGLYHTTGGLLDSVIQSVMQAAAPDADQVVGADIPKLDLDVITEAAKKINGDGGEASVTKEAIPEEAKPAEQPVATETSDAESTQELTPSKS